MKKIFITLLAISITTTIFSQKRRIVDASIALKKENYDDAKRFIDEAYTSESTMNSPKMWNYRSKIYLQIAFKKPSIDKRAIFKATEAYVKCLNTNKKGKIIVKKWSSKEEVMTGTMQCANKLFNLAVDAYNDQRYQESLDFYEPIHEVIKLDSEDRLKAMKITSESVYHNSYLSANKMNKKQLAKNYLQKLIDLNSQKPSIYSSMSKLYFEEKEYEKAIEILDRGRVLFGSDQGLINEEINLYIKLERTDDLINKLSINIKNDSSNFLYYVIRGTCYQNMKNIDSAISDYKSALKINPEELTALNNISSCYLKQTEPIVKSINSLSYNQTSKHKKLKLDLKRIHKKVLPFLERYTQLKPDDNAILNVLAEIYYKLEMYDRSKETKAKLN